MQLVGSFGILNNLHVLYMVACECVLYGLRLLYCYSFTISRPQLTTTYLQFRYTINNYTYNVYYIQIYIMYSYYTTIYIHFTRFHAKTQQPTKIICYYLIRLQSERNCDKYNAQRLYNYYREHLFSICFVLMEKYIIRIKTFFFSLN